MLVCEVLGDGLAELEGSSGSSERVGIGEESGGVEGRTRSLMRLEDAGELRANPDLP